MSYWYHGTSLENYKKIIKTGFRSGTFFAQRLSTALCYGGEYVFSVWFKDDPSTYWEWVCPRKISKNKIVFVHKFNNKLLYRNEKEYYTSCKDTLKQIYPNKKFCKKCKGSGEIGYFKKRKPDLFKRHFKKDINLKIEVCDKCKGQGCY